MGKSPDIEKILDKEQFKETLQAMSILGFSPHQVFNLTSSLYAYS